MTDMEDSSLELISDNIKLNSLTESQAQCSYLKWGSFDGIQGTFDVIVGSDIIYSTSILECLA
jgi:hypothetical protein